MRRNLICGIYVKLEYVLKTIINRIWIIFITIHEYKNIWKLRKIYKKVTLSKEQKKQIDNFYLQNYGKKISYKWHRLYQSYTGKFDYKYVPEYIFTTKLEPKANKRIEVMPYENKNMLSIFFNEKNNPNIKTPETYIMCVEGRYFDKDRNLIDKNEAIKILKNGIYDAVIKVTVDTSSGKDVHVLSLQNGIDRKTNKKIEDIITSMGKNFVVQEKIIPDKSYELLYDKSINTLRIITYMTKNGIKTAPIILRIGQGGSTVDNTNAGGIFIGVNKDGKLLEEAFTKSQKRYKVHPDTGIVFSEYQLPFTRNLVSTNGTWNVTF